MPCAKSLQRLHRVPVDQSVVSKMGNTWKYVEKTTGNKDAIPGE